jgi:hypothetical protein
MATPAWMPASHGTPAWMPASHGNAGLDAGVLVRNDLEPAPICAVPPSSTVPVRFVGPLGRVGAPVALR